MKYEINKKTILKYNMKDEFPEVFKFTGWAKSKTFDKWLGYFENNKLKYGISTVGNWFDNGYRNYDSTSYYPATHEEIKTGLIAMAERLGFKDGINTEHGIIKGGDKHEYKSTWNWFYYQNIRVFDNGIWTEIIKEPLTLEKRIERIEKIHGL